MSDPIEAPGPGDAFEAAARELDSQLKAKADSYDIERSSQHFKQELQTLDRLTGDFIGLLRAAWLAFTRYPDSDKWMLQRFTDDILESAMSVSLLAREGVFNVGRRELRYVVEAVTKYVFVDQQVPGDTELEERVRLLGDTSRVPRSSVDPIHEITFRLVDSTTFPAAVTSAFGALSGYTHASVRQLDERLRRAEKGEWTGFESAATLRSFNKLLLSTYDIVIALIFEGIGPMFTADLFEQFLDDHPKWRFHKGKFVQQVREAVA